MEYEKQLLQRQPIDGPKKDGELLRLCRHKNLGMPMQFLLKERLGRNPPMRVCWLSGIQPMMIGSTFFLLTKSNLSMTRMVFDGFRTKLGASTRLSWIQRKPPWTSSERLYRSY